MSLERQSGDFVSASVTTAAEAWHWSCCCSASQHRPKCFDFWQRCSL